MEGFYLNFMETFILENSWLGPRASWMDFGWGNGYVFLPPGHPFHGMHYDQINEHVNAHGGLTFSREIDQSYIDGWGIPSSFMGHWAVGFDTAHAGDSLHRWSKEAVQAETDQLRDQLIHHTKGLPGHEG
jgi:hypothetical protein